MAPKRKAKDPVPPSSPRRTRSATAGKRVVPPPLPARASSKKVKVAVEGADETKEKGRLKASSNGASDAAPSDADADAAATVTIAAADGISSKSVVIEACKQCNSFKTRAIKVKEGLESAVPGVTVHINPEKPRRGCFEIREEGGEVFVSLLNMPRPFTPMKKLDMDEVINDVVKKIT
ncbi:uncharacterized protein [Typha latifolia]|uniref:uncharacterized protein n=1 Tax=Typha latifolia TaxID=4733 RepID=UPI003C2B3281